MRVALINNMNNNFFSFARHLRDRGVDAHVYLFDKITDNFHPSADTFDSVSHLSYVHQVAAIEFRDFFNPLSLKVRRAISTMRSELAKFDLVVGCGMLAFFERAGLTMDIMIPYGGDIYQLTNLFQFSKKKFFPFSVLMTYIMQYQRLAVARTRAIVSFASHDANVRAALHDLKKPWINWNMPMIYPLKEVQNCQEWDFLQQHDFIVMSHLRQTWKSGTDYNGNERGICGFAKFLKARKCSKNPVYVLFEYGCDVESSKALIAQLGISSWVKWMPVMPRKYIYAGLKRSHVVTGIFNERVISHGGVSYEAFSCGVPVIGGALSRGTLNTHDVPLVHALAEDEIAQRLLEFESYPNLRKERGRASKEWFDQNLGTSLVNQYVNLMKMLVDYPQCRLEDYPFRPLAYAESLDHPCAA